MAIKEGVLLVNKYYACERYNLLLTIHYKQLSLTQHFLRVSNYIFPQVYQGHHVQE